MPFEITPVVVGSGLPAPGLPAEPVNTTTFQPVPVPATADPIRGTPPMFLQWKSAGEVLGEPDVLIVDFRYPLIATRGVGEHENVITVRREAVPPPPHVTVALSSVSAVGQVGQLSASGECVVDSGPFLLRDDWIGAAQSIATYTHDVNTVSAPNWTSSTVVTDGSGHVVLPQNSTAFMSLALSYPLKIGFVINALSTNTNRIFNFGLSGGVEGTVQDNVVELFFPITELSNSIAFDWGFALGKEIVLEYVSAGLSSHVNVYQCGTLIGAISTVSSGSNQMNSMAFFRIGRPNLPGDVYLDYLWLK